MNNLKGIIEGILFSWSEPLEIKEISETLEVSEAEVREALSRMEEEYKSSDRGLRLVRVENTVQLSTKPEHYPEIHRFFAEKKKKNLSNAGLEALSIIAYKQPVTRLEIEEIRGVNCDGIIRTLTESGYIEEVGRLDRPGKPKLYGTTPVFLKKFGLRSLKELPPMEEEEQDVSLNFLEEEL